MTPEQMGCKMQPLFFVSLFDAATLKE